MNFASLIRAFDAVMAFADATRKPRREPRAPDAGLPASQPSPGVAGQLEAKLTGVVIAALKEAFDRDHARLELERAQLEEERRRAEEALKLELRRQAADREVGRLRLLGGAALVSWLASVVILVLAAAAMAPAMRLLLGAGWILLLGALAAAFTAQGRVNARATQADHDVQDPLGQASLWMLVAGLAATAASQMFQ